MTVDDFAIISATVLAHQFCHVGSYVMIQGGSRFSQDVPPFIIAGKEPIRYAGVNLIGLRRRGFSAETIQNIHDAYRIIYQGVNTRADAIRQIKEVLPDTPEIQYIVSFIEKSERGIIK